MVHHVGPVDRGQPKTNYLTHSRGSPARHAAQDGPTADQHARASHRIAVVLHEGTNLGIPAAPIYDTQQSEEGVERREVGESQREPVFPAYWLQVLRQATQNPSGQQGQHQ